jgi:N-acetyl-beta-hexosaminidase
MFLSVCFRVESKIFPDLVNNGGRNCTGPSPRPGLVNNGFYSQAQISRLVVFARARGIRLIPEFDSEQLLLPPAV